MEHLLWNCILALQFYFRPLGLLIDVGANNGASTKRLAEHFSNHTILAIEPIRVNVNEIKRRTVNLTNVDVIRGGVGAFNSFESYGSSLDFRGWQARLETGPQYGGYLKFNSAQRNEVVKTKFEVFKIDDIVMKNYSLPLSFLHLDVEGGEEAALRGASEVLRRDRPFMSVESFPVSRKLQHKRLMDFLKLFNYEVYLIPEICGIEDCFNFFAVPEEAHVTIPKDCVLAI